MQPLHLGQLQKVPFGAAELRALAVEGEQHLDLGGGGRDREQRRAHARAQLLLVHPEQRRAQRPTQLGQLEALEQDAHLVGALRIEQVDVILGRDEGDRCRLLGRRGRRPLRCERLLELLGRQDLGGEGDRGFGGLGRPDAAVGRRRLLPEDLAQRDGRSRRGRRGRRRRRARSARRRSGWRRRQGGRRQAGGARAGGASFCGDAAGASTGRLSMVFSGEVIVRRAWTSLLLRCSELDVQTRSAATLGRRIVLHAW